MKKILLTALLGALPWLASAADINVNLGSVRVDAPGVSVTFGSRNDRGYYWDGYEYRDPDYWRRHAARVAKSTTPAAATVPHQDGGHCPPGQAKKGRC
jgi:hypothetical protein